MEGLRRCWRLKEGEGDGGAASPGAFPPARGGRRRRPAVFGVSASRGITLSCAAPACAHDRFPAQRQKPKAAWMHTMLSRSLL